MSFKIFYSWQSDLPSSKSRSIIQDAIKSAVNVLGSEMEDIEADRDTQNRTGSPDIAQTIFAKIDESDLFIADVTCVGEIQAGDKIKKSPNSNVLVELGYAAGVLGWDRIICVINTDFGAIENLPFDIRNRRVTPFSLSGKSKKDVCNDLKEIIICSAFKLKDKVKHSRRKDIFAKHKVCGYSYVRKEVTDCLVPFNPAENESYKRKVEALNTRCRDLIKNAKAVQLELSDPILNEISKENAYSGLLKSVVLEPTKYVYVKLSEDDKDEIRDRLRRGLNIEVDDDFFDVGYLKQPVITFQLFPGMHSEPEKVGTESEKRKFELLEELRTTIYELKMLESICSMFDKYLIFPLVIANESTKLDENIDISIEYEGIDPLTISDESGVVEEVPGLIYEKELLKDLFYIGDSRIDYDEDITETFSDVKKRQLVNQAGMTSLFKFDRKDYERDIQKYLAKPTDGFVKYHISNLKPGEKKFLGAALLMKKDAGKIEAEYRIKSDQSDGKIKRKITL